MKYSLYPNAIAWIRGRNDYPQLHGLVRFFQKQDGVIVEAEIVGLPKTETGFFAFHIHEGGLCTGPDFAESGGHWNPGKTTHPRHAGDLPPLLSDHGSAFMKIFTDRFQVEEVMGRAVIIHSEPDDFRTQPSGNPGAKIACGVIQKA